MCGWSLSRVMANLIWQIVLVSLVMCGKLYSDASYLLKHSSTLRMSSEEVSVELSKDQLTFNSSGRSVSFTYNEAIESLRLTGYDISSLDSVKLVISDIDCPVTILLLFFVSQRFFVSQVFIRLENRQQSILDAVELGLKSMRNLERAYFDFGPKHLPEALFKSSDDRIVSLLIRALSQHELTHIYFERLLLTEDTIASLGTIFTDNLLYLSFLNCGLDRKAVRALTSALYSSQVQRLDISQEQFDYFAYKALKMFNRRNKPKL